MNTALIAWQEMKRILGDPSGLLLTLALPLALTVAVGFISGRAPLGAAPTDGFDALSYVAPGMALFAMMFSVRQAARTTVDDADRGLTRRLRSAPVAPISIAVGRTLSGVVIVAAQLLLLIGISTLLYGLRWDHRCRCSSSASPWRYPRADGQRSSCPWAAHPGVSVLSAPLSR